MDNERLSRLSFEEKCEFEELLLKIKFSQDDNRLINNKNAQAVDYFLIPLQKILKKERRLDFSKLSYVELTALKLSMVSLLNIATNPNNSYNIREDAQGNMCDKWNSLATKENQISTCTNDNYREFMKQIMNAINNHKENSKNVNFHGNDKTLK